MGQGATAQQNQIEASQQSFMNTLQSSFGTAFAGQQNILNGLTKSLQSTLAGGPSQFGFSAPETTALNTQATSGNAQQYQFAKQAAGEAAAASGGGAAVLPTGAQGETQAELASQAAQSQSNQLLGIQEAGYKQGNQNYNNSVSGLSTVAGLENPSGLASNANSAGSAAASTAGQIQQENEAANPWTQVGGLVGSLGGAALSGFTKGLGGGLLGGGSGGSGGGGFDPNSGDSFDSTPASGLNWSGGGTSGSGGFGTSW